MAPAAPGDPLPVLGEACRFLSVNSRGTLQTDFSTAEESRTAALAQHACRNGTVERNCGCDAGGVVKR
jgi:hypothetical protein